MPDAFVPLSALLRPVEAEPIEEIPQTELAVEPCEDLDEALSCVRRFRAALADALDVALATLLEDIAASVIARELALAPADIAAIVRNATARLESESIVCVRVHPDELPALAGVALPVVADACLRRGDAAIDVRSGTISASLGVRLEAVLARW